MVGRETNIDHENVNGHKGEPGENARRDCVSLLYLIAMTER